MLNLDYEKYRWFFTLSGKLVVGGKSAEQNDGLIRILKKQKEDLIVLHTSLPGSPFSVILEGKEKVSSKDLDEVSVFTACFSRAWREGKKRAQVDAFLLSKMKKSKLMKTGTWGVKEKIKTAHAELSLVLAEQKGKLRAVPEKTAPDFFLKIKPGKTDKTKMVNKFKELLPEEFTKEDIPSALPPGGVSISR